MSVGVLQMPRAGERASERVSAWRYLRWRRGPEPDEVEGRSDEAAEPVKCAGELGAELCGTFRTIPARIRDVQALPPDDDEAI